MKKYVLVKALEGRIGPGSNAESYSFPNYEDAYEYMVNDIEEEGGGDSSEFFGNGFTDNGFFAYEIFEA